jgi:hypothetical protein
MKWILFLGLIISIFLITACQERIVEKEYVCPDGSIVLDSLDCLKKEGPEKYCDIMDKPLVELICKSKEGITYKECTIFITPDRNDGKKVSYLMYASATGTNKKEQMSANYQIPQGSSIPDKYNFYFKELTPDDESNMFIIIPYDYENKEHCEHLRVNLFFSNARIID